MSLSTESVVEAESFQDYMNRKWPKYCEAVIDSALNAAVVCRNGVISDVERDEIWDILLISNRDRQRIQRLVNENS